MSNTIIKKCTCKNDYQDKKYGKGMRVMNRTEKKPPEARCTSCGNSVKA